jgi:hypothetical protein
MESGKDSLLIVIGLGLAAVILTQSTEAQPGCTDTTWTCNTIDRLEHSNCENTRTTTPCSLASDAAEMIAGTRAIDLRYDVNDNGSVDNDDVTLLMEGTHLRTLHAAHITCTSVLTPTIQSLSEIDVNFTWTNTGEVSATFTPSVSINGGPLISLIASPITLAYGETYNAIKVLTGLSLSPGEMYAICPVPN